MTPSPVPVEWCVGQRELTEPRLSPDGSCLGWMAAKGRTVELVIETLSTGERVSLSLEAGLRGGRSMGGGSWAWMPGTERSVVACGADGELWWLTIDGRPPVRLTDLASTGRAAWSPWPAATDTGVVVAFSVDAAEVWLVECGSGGAVSPSRRLDDRAGTPGVVADFVADPCVAGGAVWWTAWDVPAMPWDASRLVGVSLDASGSWTQTGSAAVQQPRPAPDGRMTCVRDDGGWNNVWCDGRPLVDEPLEHAGPTWGPGARSFAWSSDGERLAFTRNEGGFGRLCVWSSSGVVEVARGVHGQLSWEGRSLAALRTGARTPTEVVVYDTETWDRRSLDVGPGPEWTTRRDTISEPERWSVDSIEAGGSTVVHARVYRSPATDPLGTIVWLHGGPTDQWQVTFMPRIEFWRTRGFHVVVPDHRGSTGHGRAYTQALLGRWGELDVVDVVHVVEGVQAEGWSTPATTLLFGGSAGGFTALEVACRAPHLLAGVAVAYPVTDLADLAERSHRFEAHYTVGLVGPLPETRALHDERSPVHHPERVGATPVLILHGDADPVVPVEHSRAFAVAAQGAGCPVHLHEYPGEGHGFRDPVNQRDEYARLEEFVTHALTRPRSR